MSPAIVDVRTPTPAAAAKSRNPRDKGRIFTPLFDQSSIFSNQRGENLNPNPNKAMDQSNSSQFPPVYVSGKPSLSKPRHVKVRKNASHPKPPAVQEPDRSENVQEKINRWNPFVPESAARVSESSTSENGSAFDAGAFVFGSAGPNSSRNSSFDSVKSEGGQFVSGSKPVDIGGAFVFGSGVKKNSDLSRDSLLGSDEGSVFSKLPDEMRNLDLKNQGNGDDFERKKQAENAFVFGASSVNKLSENAGMEKQAEFMSGSLSGSQPINVGSEKPTACSFSFGSEGSGNSDAGVFISGTGTKKSVDVSRGSSLGLDEGPFSKLPDEMRKLNLKNTDNVDDFKKNKQAENVFIFGGSKTASGLSSASNPESAEFVSVTGSVSGSIPINIGMKKPTVGSVSFGSKGTGNVDAGTFVFGTSVDLSQNSSLGSDESLFSKLPDEMRKMNLSSGDGFQKTKKADNVIVFGGNKDVTGSFGSGIADKVPEEAGKLNVGRESMTQSMKNESAGSAAGAFVFGRSTEKNSVSFDNGTTIDLRADAKLSGEGVEKGTETGGKDKVDEGNVFVLGTSENASASFASFEGSAVNMVRADMQKLKTSTNTENFAGTVPHEFNFQAGKVDHSSNMGFVPSSPAPGFQSCESVFSFTGKPLGLETPHMEFKTPKQDAARLTKETLFTGTYQYTSFSAKKDDAKSTRMKKKRGKSRLLAPIDQIIPAQYVSEESGLWVNPEVDSTGGYSPMDYSPYHEDVVADQYSREPSVASEDSIRFVFLGASTDTQRSVSGDDQEEVLVSAAQRLNINEGNLHQGEVGNDGSKDDLERSSNAESAFVDEQTDNFGNGCDMSKHVNAGLDNDARTASMDAETGFFSSNIERPASEVRNEFAFSSSLEDLGKSNFAFIASPFVQGPLSTAKHNYRRKNRLKSGQNPSTIPNARVPLASPLLASTSVLPDSVGQQSSSSVPQSEDEIKTRKSKESEARQESTSSATASVSAQEACEKWRFRGNQAYANGYLTKAEDYYTRGVNSVSLKEIPSGCIRPLALCYSNRAATRMSLGKMREALSDCMVSVSVDPSFLKARVRVANCHLALGEIGEALKHFQKSLQSEKHISSDQKYFIEASDGLQKAQQVADLTGQSAELLLRRTSNDASKALNVISEALSISPHSESLLEMKAEALLMLRNYEEVIKFCEQTLDLAEQNSAVSDSDSQFKNVDSFEYMKSSPARLWRWRIIAKSYFYLGKLGEALELLQKHETLKHAVDKSSESFRSFAVTIRELLRLKSAGNEAFQAARHSEAVEHYSSALACNAESRPFTAVCFCNRAAAYQALAQITDAIADCSLAIALDHSYPKAISRRATLHEMIRDYGQAVNDLNRLVSLLEKQMEEKDNQSRGMERSTVNSTHLKRAQSRLATIEEESRKGITLNMYMILGIEASSSAADIKKAYRKAALRHHPDKAGQFLVRNENVDDGLWREVAGEVHADADRLFKMIGEAYTTLSDPTKRLQYDDEEEMRTCPIMGYTASTPKTSSDNYGSHYETSFSRRQWRAHRSTYQRG